MSGDLEARLRGLVDDLEIRRVMHEYAASTDARDWPALRAVLDDDVVVDYHNGRTVVTGADEVVTYIEENTAHLAWQHHQITTYRVDVDVDGDRASGLSYLTSHQVIAADPSQLLMMVAQYACEFVRADGTWRLSRMVHTIRANNFVPHRPDAPTDVRIPPAVRP